MAVNDFIVDETLVEKANASSPALKKELNYSTQKLEIDRVEKLYYEQSKYDKHITSHEIRHDNQSMLNVREKGQFIDTEKGTDIHYSGSRGTLEPDIASKVNNENKKTTSPMTTRRKKHPSKIKQSLKQGSGNVQVLQQLRKDDEYSPPPNER